ncbi:MAG: uncharacterized protein KVP18_000987 [Porospora cf. gigantea A]|uniref:uncharacterized protein n=1 Tax=Porospora cf. gigantea A TaxID=2853593 RepID=UPI00355AA1AD|nr:MAG: hypothetical protein KVP18_000987 [Porospora cf. gigantea A]
MVLNHARFNKSVTGSWLKKSLGAGVTFGGTTHFTPLFECEAADQRLDHVKSDETSVPPSLEQWEPAVTRHPSGWTPQQIEPVHILPAIDLAATFEWPVVFAVSAEWRDKTCTIDFVSTGPHGAQLVGLSSCLDLRTIPTLHSEFSTVVLSVLDQTLAKVGELRVCLSVKRRPASGVASPACHSPSHVNGASGRTLPLSPASPPRSVKVARALRGRWLHPVSYTVISFPDHLDFRGATPILELALDGKTYMGQSFHLHCPAFHSEGEGEVHFELENRDAESDSADSLILCQPLKLHTTGSRFLSDVIMSSSPILCRGSHTSRVRPEYFPDGGFSFPRLDGAALQFEGEPCGARGGSQAYVYCCRPLACSEMQLMQLHCFYNNGSVPPTKDLDGWETRCITLCH